MISLIERQFVHELNKHSVRATDDETTQVFCLERKSQLPSFWQNLFWTFETRN